ncbi:MAG: asparagine synthase (glutamine-hydrolyzing) [Sphingomicrobium sp.]
MCGIAGAIGPLRPNDVATCEAMNERLRHRGPDDSGSWTWQVGEPFGAILCHRRLSIIDLRAVAAQPMVSPATGTTLVFNGEIYNFRELRAELEAAGARFFTNGDSEVILNGYDKWGVNVFARLRGMFALVLVDPRKGRAVLARDGYGIKPLYWARFTGADGRPALAFASEGRALVQAGLAERRTDPYRIGQYLWNGFMPGPSTIWNEIEEVPRGCYAILDKDHAAPSFERFWDIGLSLRQASRIDLEKADGLIADTAKAHLIADVPVVVFLSGGIESTAVAAAAARASEVHTLTVAFDDTAADERRFAETAAAAIGSDHHVIELTAEGILHDLEEAGSALDQPSFDGVNSWFVSREAARLGFKVALSGAGGDELAGGYTSFRRALRAEPMMGLPGGRLAARIGGRALQRLRPRSKAGQLALGFGELERMYQSQYALFSRGSLRRLVAAADQLCPWGLEEDRAAELRAEIRELSTLQAVTALESEMYLGDRLLRDMDSVSMAHSLEIRVPLVDTVLSDSIAGLSDADRYLPVGRKQLLRRQSRDVLPDTFFSRPKRGFEFPMDSWMRGPLRKSVEARLLDAKQSQVLGLRPEAVAEIWRRFIERPGTVYWTRPWALFALLQWASANGVSC